MGSAVLDRKVSELSIQLWPPGQRTRKRITERMVGTLMSVSCVRLDGNEAANLAEKLEDLAFKEGQQETDLATVPNHGSVAVKTYAKCASRLLIEVLKTGKLKEPVESEVITDVRIVGEDIEDTASSAEDSEVFDISGGTRNVLDGAEAEKLFVPLLEKKGKSVTKIKLSNWSLKKEAAEVASRYISEIAERLKDVDLSDIVAGRPEAEALEVMTILANCLEKSNLTSLNLSDNALGEKGVRAFGSLLSTQKHLKHLFFINNGISEDAANAICELLPSAEQLVTLHFHNNMTGDVGAEKLCLLIKQAVNLEDIRISSSRIGGKGALAVAEALKSGSDLLRIDLRDNMFGKGGGLALSEMLPFHARLSEVYLSDLGLEDEGAMAVLNALKKGGGDLKVLDLGYNEMSWECGVAIASLLVEKKGLVKLNVEENELGDKGVMEISKVMMENEEVGGKLEELNMSVNDVGSKGGVAVALAVAAKSSFKRLYLDSNHFSASALIKLRQILDDDGCCGSSVLVDLEDNEDEDDEEEEEED